MAATKRRKIYVTKHLADGSEKTYSYTKTYAQGPRSFASITVALTEDEAEKIAKRAVKEGKTGAQYLRDRGLS